MDLFADHTKRTHQGLPGRVDVRCLRQQREPRFERRCLSLRVHSRKSQAIDGHRAGRDVAELDQNLRRDVQHLAAPVQFQHSPGGNGMLSV